jgi:hypothetical protein
MVVRLFSFLSSSNSKAQTVDEREIHRSPPDPEAA